MSAEDAERLFRLAERRLRAGQVYNVCTLQNGLGLSALELIDAVNSGEIERSLGENLNLCLLGNDVVDFLRARTDKRMTPW